MIEVLEFTFQSFWHFVGVSILLGSILTGGERTIKVFMTNEGMKKGVKE